jgi:hypothetical protein
VPPLASAAPDSAAQKTTDPLRRRSRAPEIILLGAAVILGLTRSTLDSYFTRHEVDLPPPPAVPWQPTASRVVLIVLDGLRPMEAFSPHHMPALARRREQAAWGIARSSEITMTATGVRMLGTGVSSDFMEIFHNWSPRPSTATSLLALAKMKGLRTVAFGDHCWNKIFPGHLDRYVDVSLDAWSYYIDAHRAPDLSHLGHIREFLASKEAFDLMIVHLVGPDHASHRFRVTSQAYQDYTHWLDPKVDDLLNSLLAAGATVVLTSDHGMSDVGQHGGAEPTARKTPYLWQGPGIRSGAGPLISQADIPATMAALLGLPALPHGEGRVTHAVLDASPATLLAMMVANVHQARTYLQHYQAKYGGVPRALLDSAPDLPSLASEHGISQALARADEYLDRARDQRLSVEKNGWRSWAWIVAACLFALVVLIPGSPSQRPFLVLAAAGLAFALSAASWATSAMLWPAVIVVILASLFLGRDHVARLWSSARARRLMGVAGLAAMGLLVLAYVGFSRQFRSETIVGTASDLAYRAAGYVMSILLGGVLLRRRRASAVSDETSRPWIPMAVFLCFFFMFPSGQLLLRMAPGLGLGFLWIHRLATVKATGPSTTWMAWAEAEWRLLAVSLAWIVAETWGKLHAGTIDQGQGFVGWSLSHVPWGLAPLLVAQQIVLWKGTPGRLAKALGCLTVLALAPALVLTSTSSDHFNLSLGLALVAMVLAQLNRRSPIALYQLGAATFALTRLFGSASYALMCLVLVGTAWVFLLNSAEHKAQAVEPSTEAERAGALPVFAALAICFVWLAVHLFRDGSFSFSDYEVTVGFFGNPTHQIGRGAVQVSARFVLPMVLLVLPLQRTASGTRILGVMMALFLVHIAYLLVGFHATQSQFYTPYRLAGELAHFIALILCVPLLFLLFGTRAKPPSVHSAARVPIR